MSIAAAFLAEFNRECVATRKCLERVPGEKLSWQPHPRSMTIGQLADHIAIVPAAILRMVSSDETKMEELKDPLRQPESVDAILGAFDEMVAAVRAELPGVSDARMHEHWRMTMAGSAILDLPRMAFLRSVMLNHWYHHRGQLSVYLRLLDIPVPSIYGPSADAPPAFMQKG